MLAHDGRRSLWGLPERIDSFARTTLERRPFDADTVLYLEEAQTGNIL